MYYIIMESWGNHGTKSKPFPAHSLLRIKRVFSWVYLEHPVAGVHPIAPTAARAPIMIGIYTFY